MNVVSQVCDEDHYYYGYNGQKKDNEWAGVGNHTTALFWEFDTRTGRRGNLDPILKVWESPYACFSNSPIWKVDPNGNDDYYNFSGKWVGNDGKGGDIRLIRCPSIQAFSEELATKGEQQMKLDHNIKVTVQNNDQFNSVVNDIRVNSTDKNIEQKGYIVLDVKNFTLGLEKQPQDPRDDDGQCINDYSNCNPNGTDRSMDYKAVRGSACTKIIVG
jgi:hypothetical protein